MSPSGMVCFSMMIRPAIRIGTSRGPQEHLDFVLGRVCAGCGRIGTGDASRVLVVLVGDAGPDVQSSVSVLILTDNILEGQGQYRLDALLQVTAGVAVGIEERGRSDRADSREALETGTKDQCRQSPRRASAMGSIVVPDPRPTSNRSLAPDPKCASTAISGMVSPGTHSGSS